MDEISRELDIPIIALTELNRHPYGRSHSSYFNPRLEDLEESSSPEYDADIILFLRDETGGPLSSWA